MHIVGCHVARLVARSQTQQSLVDGLQVGNIVLLEFQKEVVRSENVVIPVQLGAGGIRTFIHDGARYFRRHAA